MARRKRELLDLLRERPPQNGVADGDSESHPKRPKPPVPAKKPAPAKPPAASKNSTTAKKVAAPTAASRPSMMRSTATAKSSAFSTSFLTALKTPLLVVAVIGLVALGLALPRLFGDHSGLEAAGGGAVQPYAILAAQYAPSREDIARSTALAIREQLGEGIPVQLIHYPGPKQDWLELWIGEAAEGSALDALLTRIQTARVPTDRNNPEPFATARIERRRKVTAD